MENLLMQLLEESKKSKAKLSALKNSYSNDK